MAIENDSNELFSFSRLYGSILDRRIIQSLTSNNYLIPTKVQVEVIKKIIEGKDLLINSYTGSGKTLAYAIPICHNLLNMSKRSANKLYSLVLVPSRELVIQTYEVFEQLLAFCENIVSIGTVFNADDNLLHKGKNLKLGGFHHNILISTPGDILSAKGMSFKDSIFQNIVHLIIDEADLLFAFGYEKDMSKVLGLLPNSQDRKYQCILLSATLNKEVDSLKKMVLHRPVFVDVKPEIKEDNFDEESINSKHQTSGLISEYYTICNSMVDKWLMLYILLKMNVIPRKCLVFVSDVDTAYSIKLFLERFGMSCGVLTPIIPAATRRILIQCFNQGSYDILVTSDTINEKDESVLSILKDNSITYRGVDYKEVASVFNFDCPSSVRSYIHHIGRTARGGASGVSITIVNGNIPNEMEVLDELLNDSNRKMNKLKITSEEVACFRYRIEDCMRILTKSNIQRHKLQEIQGLILNNTRLLKSGYFNKHPGDKSVLKSYHKHITNALNISNSGREHIKNIPGYLYDMVNSNISNNSDSLIDSQSSMPNISMDGVLSNTSNGNNIGSLTEKVQEAIRRMGGKDFQFVRENNLNPTNMNKTGNSNGKKRTITRKSQLKKEPKSYEGTVPDELPVISGRKLWKLKHKKRVKKYKDFIDDNKYKRKRGVRR
ncbi:ATP-dependent nucleolar RNA helicase [Cryptosporidium sp. chipmunk genotype I]|uniref:ATP-dependent nucleolar RNA helicase n=1 Tax=Cryptosporidium sp. chipmunk genotype I TaxID=1280935 RepID=UPI00351A5B85|nr:ATP-dependent nucleolar RNA helicase [Cryptosporidium sp. chipmunk genotype I]